MKQNSPSRPRTTQACGACKRRKVRCDGLQPCEQCQRHTLPCTYLAASVKAHSRSRLRAAERGAIINASRVCDTMSSGRTRPEMSQYDLDFFYNLIPEYMSRVYPVTPVLDEVELRFNINQMDSNGHKSDTAALAYACAGITLLLLQNDRPWSPGCYQQATDMIELSISCHEPIKLDGEPTWARLLSRLFLEMCLLVLHKNELAFFYLHEAVSQILMQGIDRFLKHESLCPTERARRERVYWICYIHERHLALEAGTIVCLDPLPALPNVSATAFGSIERGWNYILHTFLVIDKDFIRLWNGDRSSVTAEWIIKKHQELTDGLWQREVSTLPITQQADLIITRQWLQTLTWQMAMSNALLSSEAGGFEGLSLFLPLTLSAHLKGFLSRISKEAIQIHGIGIIEKLFEITTTIADIVVALAPGHYPEAKARVPDVLFMKQFFLGLPHVKDIHRAIIEEKMLQIEAAHIDVGQRFAQDSIDGVGNKRV